MATLKKARALKAKLRHKPKTQNAIHFNKSFSEEEYDHTYDIGTTCDDFTNSQAHEILANVKFCTPKQWTIAE